MDFAPATGDAVAKLVAETLNASDPVVAQARKILGL
jgi:hypothetical protein